MDCRISISTTDYGIYRYPDYCTGLEIIYLTEDTTKRQQLPVR
jgi:hypothetical protein